MQIRLYYSSALNPSVAFYVCIFHEIAFKSLCPPPLSYLTFSHPFFTWLVPYVPRCLLTNIMGYLTLTALLISRSLLGEHLSQSAQEIINSLAFGSVFSRTFFINFISVSFLRLYFYLVHMFIILTRTHHYTSWFINKSKCLYKVDSMPCLSHTFNAYCMHIVGA